MKVTKETLLTISNAICPTSPVNTLKSLLFTINPSEPAEALIVGNGPPVSDPLPKISSPSIRTSGAVTSIPTSYEDAYIVGVSPLAAAMVTETFTVN